MAFGKKAAEYVLVGYGISSNLQHAQSLGKEYAKDLKIYGDGSGMVPCYQVDFEEDSKAIVIITSHGLNNNGLNHKIVLCDHPNTIRHTTYQIFDSLKNYTKQLYSEYPSWDKKEYPRGFQAHIELFSCYVPSGVFYYGNFYFR